MFIRFLLKFRRVLFGVLVGFGLASVGLMFWTNQMQAHNKMEIPVVSYHAEDLPLVDTSLMKSSSTSKQTEAIRKQNEETTTKDEQDSEVNLHNAYKHVKSILFFIGYPRSRHSLLGSLLDAHPHMVVADESMAFPRWRRNSKEWLNGSIYAFYDTLLGSSQLAMKGRRSHVFEGSVVNKTSAYGYFVPNQWQGNYDGYIEVIGDKTGAFTAKAMLRKNSVEAVHLLEKASGTKVKFVHVVRNPFDNLATMTLEHSTIQKRNGDHQSKINASAILDAQITRYFHWAAGCDKTRKAFHDKVIDIPSMELVKHPADILRKICAFLEITCSEDYIQDCANTVDPVPSTTRNFVEWTEKQKSKVYEEMKHFSFFDGYSYDV